ncbi:MAG: glucose-1-phosphate adenylyltransferase [Micrococcales bacterium]|nr:glucose-1-phosphate adenylyltransferase [Micrococcales bacterium]
MRGRERVLAIVQAGGQGGRMDVLTRERAKPALPFAGTYRLIDFALSSLTNSGIADVWVSVQYQASSLDPHLSGGRPWDLDRTVGGYRRVVPEEGGGAHSQTGFSSGNADDLHLIRDDIERFAPTIVLVLSADHVFACDLLDVVESYRGRDAECAVVTAEVGVREAAHKAAIVTDATGLVTGIEYKSDRPSTGTIATEITLYDPEVLLGTLDQMRREASRSGRLEDDGLGDFDQLLERVVARRRTIAVPLEGYWRDVGRPAAYLAAHRDLLAGRVDVFERPYGKVRGAGVYLPPPIIHAEAEVHGSMVSAGSDVRGRVVRSVIGPGARIGPGVSVEDSVLLDGVVVEAGASVHTAIVDERTVIGRDAVVGAATTRRSPRDEDIVLVGRETRVRRGRTLEAGDRVEPGSVV